MSDATAQRALLDRGHGRVASDGLTAAEVAERVAQGLTNQDPSRRVDDWDVVRRNVLSSFNVILASLIAALLVVGEVRDGLFVGAVVVANVVIATGQEVIATRRLQALQAITAPRATVIRDGQTLEVHASEVVQGDLLALAPGGQAVADGTIEAGTVELDESMLTGESSSIRRGAGDSMRSGTFCIGGACRYRADRVGAEAYALRLTSEARDGIARHTPLMLQFNRLLRVLLTATVVLAAALFIQFNVQEQGLAESLKATTATVTTVVPVGMLLGITVVVAVGALRVSRSGAIVQDMHAVEALNYVDVVAFDKTGTITSNKLRLDEVIWVGPEEERTALTSFAADAIAESRTVRAIAEGLEAATHQPPGVVTGRVSFSSARRWSGIEWDAGGQLRAYILGAPETVLEGVADDRGLRARYAEVAQRGLRGVVFARVDALREHRAELTGVTPLALVVLADELRGDIREAFALMDTLGIEPKIISGDSPETVAALLAQLGITPRGATITGAELSGLSDAQLADVAERTTIFGRVDPLLKARIIEALKSRDHFVAMVGDGANDVHALRAADVGVAMASGTQMATGVAGIVLLNDSFTAFIRGIREATFVLGNCRRLSKLFLAKSIYAFLLILATNMLGLDFPFLPRQAGVTSTLTLGIPAIFIAVGVPSRTSPRDLSADVLRFALPAGLALAASAIAMQFIVEGLLGRGIEEARTLVNMTIGIVGVVYAVEVLGLEDVNLRRPTRLVLTVGLAAVLLVTLVVVTNEPRLREFFAFSPMSGIGWVSVVVAASAALSAQYLLARHWQRALDFLTAKPGLRERVRGKAR